MKKLSDVVCELREQIEEATDPKNPNKLLGYTEALRDGMSSIITELNDDPTLAALAFHGQIKFVNKRAVEAISERNNISQDDWKSLKEAISVRPGAHKAVKLLEEASLQGVLVIAVIANFKLKEQRHAESAAQEEGEYEQV